MKALRILTLLALLPAIACGEELELQTKALIDTPLYDKARVETELIQRIEAGVYEGYQAELCIDDLPRCNSDVFEPYKKVENGQINYVLTIQKAAWSDLPLPVKEEAVHEIVYYTWGDAKRPYSPLDVVINGVQPKTSPLTYLSAKSNEHYLRFAVPESLHGGLGGKAYGPNCWYNSISAIADGNSIYARSKMLTPTSWDRRRFMGPSEFRHHMQNFTQVLIPQFGDIIRYYTDAPLYGGYRNLVYGGEVHAAVYIGKEAYTDEVGNKAVRDIALTKNGRSDLDFLFFQDVRGLDESYLASAEDTASVTNSSHLIKKGYFRVNRGATILDPAMSGKLAGSYGSYLVDIKNYMDRWLCLGKFISPPVGKNLTCLNYPVNWLVLQYPNAEPKQLKIQPALRLKPVEISPRQTLAKENHGG